MVLWIERESITCLSTAGGGVGQFIWRLKLGRLVLLLMLSISSSASVVVLLHSQGGGGAVEQSHVELDPSEGLVDGLEVIIVWWYRRYPPEASRTRNRTLLTVENSMIFHLLTHVSSCVQCRFISRCLISLLTRVKCLICVRHTPAPQLGPFLKHSSQSRLNVNSYLSFFQIKKSKYCLEPQWHFLLNLQHWVCKPEESGPHRHSQVPLTPIHHPQDHS